MDSQSSARESVVDRPEDRSYYWECERCGTVVSAASVPTVLAIFGPTLLCGPCRRFPDEAVAAARAGFERVEAWRQALRAMHRPLHGLRGC
jgi:hypothetical protein